MKHQFALYIPDISTGTNECIDELLLHRIIHVIRLNVGEHCMVFNRDVHAQAKIITIDKKAIVFNVETLIPNQILKPPIHFFLPLLKRESLEQAVYGLTELGVTEIYLTRTEKSLKIISEKQFNRLHKIIIAAAEQSKNFAFPTLKSPSELSDVVKQLPKQSIFFDPAGESFEKILNQLDTNIGPIGLLIGPEGDLTSPEKELLKQHKVAFSRLTPTILRSFQAAIVGVGIIRSLINK